MIERECALEAVRRDLAPREHRPGIVEQDVDARLRRGDVCRGPLDLGKPKQVGIVDAVPCRGKRSRSCASIASPRCLLRAIMTMRAPIAANASAAARPIPDVAPVMTQVFPSMLAARSNRSAAIASRVN